MGDEELLEPDILTAEADDDDEEGPDIVRIEFPIEVIVLGSLSAADRQAVVDDVLMQLQNALDEAP